MTKKKILIVGGCGFIGREVLKFLDDYQCYVVSSRSNYKFTAKSNNICFQRCDISNLEQVTNLLEKENFSHLLFLSWPTSPPHNTLEHSSFAAHAIRFCKKFADVNHEARIIFTGSMHETGINTGIIPNSFDNMFPKSLYGISKKFVWDSLKSLDIKHLCWLRLANVYGYEDHTQKILPQIIINTINKETVQFYDPNGFVDFIHVSDIANGIILAINSNYNGVINLGYGSGYYLQDIQNFIHCLLFNQKNLINHGTIKSYQQSNSGPVLDITSSKDILGYSPKISIELGLKEILELHYLNQNL
jgi:nucleoside-diphosphate-sugar epimerase